MPLYLNGALQGAAATAITGWETLASTSASGAGTVDFENAAHFDGTFKLLKVVFSGVNSSVDNTNLLVRFKVGGSYLSTNIYVHRSEAFRGTVSETVTSDATSSIVVIGTATYKMGTGVNEKFDGEVTLGDPSTTDQDRSCVFDVWGEGQDTGHGCTIDGGGGVNDPGALQGIRFLASAGNLTGTFTLMGSKLTV